ncbi:MAG TPA: MauE/DoxX family redox-associated membrane protein [Verrucomicrobiae bacterium]|nr:MauE/DoxX family redox-associated membrane protein [Verrucomicrobiae bacterium]
MDPVVDATLRTALALLFFVAAGHKLRDLGRFRATLGEYRLLPAALTPLAAALVVAAEVGAAGALVAPGTRAAGLLSAAFLLALYGAAVAINLARGRRDLDCGCAGPAVRRPISGALVARNAALAALALAGLAPVRARALLWVDAVTVAGASAALAAIYASLDRVIAYAPGLSRLRGDA